MQNYIYSLQVGEVAAHDSATESSLIKRQLKSYSRTPTGLHSLLHFGQHIHFAAKSKQPIFQLG